MSRLAGHIALITGASRGIGRAVALRFAKEGAHVIAVARTVGALEALDDDIKTLGGSATLVPLDVRDGAKIDELGGVIFQRFGKLDILVGNAAILGALSPLAHAEPDMWQRVMDINLTANYRFIRSMDPLLRASDAGRAIFVTSGVTEAHFPYWGPYAVSKAALEMLVLTYAAEMEKTNVKVNLLDPGIIRTSMRAEAMPGEDPDTLPDPESITGQFVELAEARWKKTGEKVSCY